VAQLPAGIADRSSAPLLFAFKYVGHPWALTLQATKHQDVEVLTCAIDRADLVSFLTKDGELVTRASYVIRNNREQFIRLTLPTGARVFSTFRDDQPVQPSKDEKGRILIPLEKSAGGSGQARSFTVEITYLTQLPKLSRWFGTIDLKAPATDIIANSMKWMIYVPINYKYKLRKASMEEKPNEIGNFQIFLSDGEQTKSKSANEEYKMTFNTSQAANVDQGQGWFVQAAMPVRFAVPQSGVNLLFVKDFVMQDQANYITLGYRKIPKAVSTARRVLRFTIAVILLLLVVWYWRRRSRRKKELEEFRPQGVTP
jgi:hypothetical protein